jgi:hypothetical protein
VTCNTVTSQIRSPISRSHDLTISRTKDPSARSLPLFVTLSGDPYNGVNRRAERVGLLTCGKPNAQTTSPDARAGLRDCATSAGAKHRRRRVARAHQVRPGQAAAHLPAARHQRCDGPSRPGRASTGAGADHVDAGARRGPRALARRSGRGTAAGLRDVADPAAHASADAVGRQRAADDARTLRPGRRHRTLTHHRAVEASQS